jgi:hypothetical protein
MKKATLLLLSLAFAFASSGPAFAAGYTYKCYGTGSDRGEQVELKLRGKKAWLDGSEGSFDGSYTGGDSARYDRFAGFDSSEGSTEVLVEKKLRTGEDKGFIRVQNRGEGLISTTYLCRLQ